MVDKLKAIQTDAILLARLDGFGDLLSSGVTLAAKFEKKAAGGDYSLDRAIADHIDVVQQMQQVFERIEAKYSATDTSAAQGISGSGTTRGN